MASCVSCLIKISSSTCKDSDRVTTLFQNTEIALAITKKKSGIEETHLMMKVIEKRALTKLRYFLVKKRA